MTKIFDNPANEMEREIAEYIKPLLTPEVEKKIEKDKLTLGGCLKSCYDKGKKYQVKTKGGGIARISEEQHFKWVREYFGIKGTVPVPSQEEKPTEAAKSGTLNIDLDSLFD